MPKSQKALGNTYQKIRLKCKNCGAETRLSVPAPDQTMSEYSMRVVSHPYYADDQVWFWSEREDRFYLNLSCKRELDLVFLKTGQDIITKGTIQMENVRVKWICESCGKEMVDDRVLPCLINKDTKISFGKT